MAIETQQTKEELLRLFDGEKSHACSSPALLDNTLVYKALKSAASLPNFSPGLDVLNKLRSYIFVSGEEYSYLEASLEDSKSEIEAKANPWLPTVGVELEIPFDIFLNDWKKEYYRRLDALGFAHGIEDCSWEFQLPYSYSWKTQAQILHALLGLQFIPFNQSNFDPSWRGRSVAEVDGYSLHYNLGIPADITIVHGSAKAEVFYDDAQFLAMAAGLAFSTPGRLLNRKTTTDVIIEKECSGSEKTEERAAYGRVELRPLGFGNLHSYRQLAALQDIGAAFFAYHRDDLPTQIRLSHEDQYLPLAVLWRDTSLKIRAILRNYSVLPAAFSCKEPQLERELREILDTTKVQHQSRICLLSAAVSARRIMGSLS